MNTENSKENSRKAQSSPDIKNPGIANPIEDQPTYRPPETQPEPRPVDPVMNKNNSSLPSANTNTQSPA